MSSVIRSNRTGAHWMLALAAVSVPMASCYSQQPAEDPPDGGVVGTTQALLTTPPELGCATNTFGGKTYFFCPLLHTREVARGLCQLVGADLVSIGSAAEDTFVAQNTGAVAWIGANDIEVEGTWRWSSSGIAFWQGTAVGGSAINGQYSKWFPDEPDALVPVTEDCAALDISGQWGSKPCTLALPYVCEERSNSDCYETVLGKAKAAAAPGAEVLDPIVQADLLRCATPSLTSCEASYFGAVAFDLYMVTKQAIAGTITPSQMIALKQDRARKANVQATIVSVWLSGYCKGDADGDLVANDFDDCPNTPPLTPTTDRGCPVTTPLPVGPSKANFQKAMGAAGLIQDKDCIGAPHPTPPVNVYVTGVTGNVILWGDRQPASACERWYEISVVVRRPNGTTVNDHFAVRRRDSDADINPTPGERTELCLDAVRGTLHGQCIEMGYGGTGVGTVPAPYPWWSAGDRVDVGVRTFDGNGNRSTWTHYTDTRR